MSNSVKWWKRNFGTENSARIMHARGIVTKDPKLSSNALQEEALRQIGRSAGSMSSADSRSIAQHTSVCDKQRAAAKDGSNSLL